MYEELAPKGLEIIAVAQDTAGEQAAGRFYDAAEATFASLLDTTHTVSSLYGMVNVPTGVMIDEEGVIVRWDEGTYTRTYQAGALSFGTDEYVPILRDWVENGAESRYAQDRETISGRLARPSRSEAEADVNFRLGVYFHQAGNEELAKRHWETAQRLHPQSWNYHRQDWSFTPETAGQKWFQKFRELEGKPYYEPLDLPE